MSKEPQPLPASTGADVRTEPSSSSPGGREPAIRRQAAEIIESVLAGSDPDQAEIRDVLRGCLAAHPARPETALLEHLMTIRALDRFRDRMQDTIPDRPASPPLTGSLFPYSEAVVRSRIEAVLEGRLLVTAFQPICDLATGGVVGAGAFTRFLSEGGDTAGDWFAGAKQAQLGGDLEFAALESALAAAADLPGHLYVGLKLSPATCLDPLLPVLLEETELDPGRMVLELTEALAREQPAPLVAALAPLRAQGLRLAVDHAGSFFTSIRQIRHLRPEIIKLDRNLIAGIDTDTLRSSLGEAMVGFAEQIGATVIAQGIETAGELATATSLGMTAGQGYLLGRPTTRPADWKDWSPAARGKPGLLHVDRDLR
ncbi:EAL domain-containing protein [Arthrobacter bambusae]|uniref:EAL domain-containing protein n=1 Tax=Arthrobacter bambusae TaxID=1338426 RepID=UPI0027829F74|nr:EAL domain-containing protein [Arthrobacter bambusae]MDQ0212641.1 EAL domain-containing protein (putative c-di-GMP-specific phosphodiesterase class I) [Arthrobacter bambusae]MDQ0237082.1 EAL domain-containing protein (putative c-di-GMP-specific phosphodiesterase class I) [Arthrobacter bambusae]